MNINDQEILSTILNFLELLENGNSTTNIEFLDLELDKLALFYHLIGNISDDEKEDFSSPMHDYQKWRKLASERFPHLGYYNLPSAISEQVGKAELHTGDAIDDLADIANELSEVAWRSQNNSQNDALWYFRFSYDAHWGAHLRSLQMYLHDIFIVKNNGQNFSKAVTEFR